MAYIKWQDVIKYAGSGAISIIAVMVLVMNLAGMSYTVPGDKECGTDCYSEVKVNSTYWEVCVEHSGDQLLIYKKVSTSRRLWLNLDKMGEFIPTDPTVSVELMVPATSKTATIKDMELGYLRPVKDGDCIIQRGKVNRMIIHGTKETWQTVKWGMEFSSLFSQDITFDPKWIGENETAFYTPSEETHCINGVCTLTMYSGRVFTKEPDGWHTLTEVSNVKWENGGFNFSYRDYWVLIEPFVIYNGNFKTIQDIKNAFLNVNLKDYISTDRFNHKFAINLSNVNQTLIDNTNYIGFRLKDSHGLAWKDVRKTSAQSVVIKNKVEINYGDLIESGFTLNMVNRTYLLIGNISNNSADGMIYIDPTITLVGDTNEVLVPEGGNITLGTNEYTITNTYQTTLVPTVPSATNNVTRGTIAETTHPAVIAGTILTAAQYAMVNATGGTQYTVAGTASTDVYFMWNITLPQVATLNWVNVLATMNTSGTTDLKHIALWNFSSNAWVNAFSATFGTTFTNATFNITGTNLTWFVRNNRTIYFLPHGSGTATGNLGIDYLEAKVSYNNSTSSNAGNWTNVTDSDNSYWIIKADSNVKTGANFSYITELENPSSIEINSEFKQSATAMNLRVYIFNFTGNNWYDLSGADLNPIVDTWYNYTITSRVSDFINSTTKRIYTKIESTSNGVGSGYLFIDDPVITLNGTNGGNVGDTFITSNDNSQNNGAATTISIRSWNFGDNRILMLWNLSVIPAGSTIINANLSMNMSTAPSGSRWYVAYNTSLYNSTGQGPWVEGSLSGVACSGTGCEITRNVTRDNQPFCQFPNCAPPAGDILQDNRSTGTTSKILMYWNVTNAAINSFANATNKNMSIFIRDNAENTGGGIIGTFNSKENALVSSRPQLVVTYTLDTTPPTYNIVGTNNSNPIPLEQVLHYANWSDNVGLSGYIFSWNATGATCSDGFSNDTWADFSGGTWSNTTKQMPLACAGKTIDFKFYANDTSNNWNVTTDTYENETSGGDTCDCSSIQAGTAINCAEGCTISACNVGGIAVTFTGAGTITVSGDVTNILSTTMPVGCTMVRPAGVQWG